MKSYSLKTYPARELRKKAARVHKVDDGVRKLLDEMVSVMREHEGIGLAAPQIGVGMRIAVVDAGDGIVKIINPVIVECAGSDSMEEGCLSVPSTLVLVKRAKSITLEYINDQGEKVVARYSGMTAKAIQHEIDHLDGRLIIDYMPWFKKLLKRGAKRR